MDIFWWHHSFSMRDVLLKIVSCSIFSRRCFLCELKFSDDVLFNEQYREKALAAAPSWISLSEGMTGNLKTLNMRTDCSRIDESMMAQSYNRY